MDRTTRSRHRSGGIADRRGRLGGAAAHRPAAYAGVEVKVYDPFGWMGFLALNHLYPPLDDLKLRRALLPAVDQHAFVQSIVGEQSDLGRVPVGYVTDGSPMANKAGLAALSSTRDVALAKKSRPIGLQG